MLRMYVDETGNSKIINLKNLKSQKPENQHLSLTGVIFDYDYVLAFLEHELTSFKKEFFRWDPDHQVVFHRREIERQVGEFTLLKDENRRKAFHAGFADLLGRMPFMAVTIFMDKFDRAGTYPNWNADPYHVVFQNLTERFFLECQARQTTGDVIIEARNQEENKRLTELYKKFREAGLGYINAKDFSNRLPADAPSFKDKRANVAGLQIADMIANPSHVYCRKLFTGYNKLGFYDKQIVDVLVAQKYRRRGTNIDGYGVKWIPEPKKLNGPTQGAAQAYSL